MVWKESCHKEKRSEKGRSSDMGGAEESWLQIYVRLEIYDFNRMQ